jgi:ATP synthase protein I
MLITVALQALAITVLSVLALFIYGPLQAWSLVYGGAAATVPCALFALRLTMHRRQPAESYLTVFFLGEFIKIGLTVALLGAVIKWAGPLHWPSLLIGLIVALKMPLFGLWILGDKTPVSREASAAGLAQQ